MHLPIQRIYLQGMQTIRRILNVVDDLFLVYTESLCSFSYCQKTGTIQELLSLLILCG